MKFRKLSFNLSSYLIISEVVLAAIIIFIWYPSTKRLVIDNLFYKLQYNSGEAISPIQNSMNETKVMIDNFTSEFEKSHFAKYPDLYAKSALNVKPAIVTFWFATLDEKNSTELNTDLFYYHVGDTVMEDKDSFYNDYSEAGIWMNKASQTEVSEWSSPFNSVNKIDGSYKQILIYARPFKFDTGEKPTKAIVFCAISIDNELKALNGLDKNIPGITTLISDKGVVIYSSQQDQIKDNQANLFQFFQKRVDLNKVLKEKTKGSLKGYHDSSGGRKYLTMYWFVRDINWLMIAAVPTSVYMAEMDRMLFIMILIVLFISSVSAAVSVYFSMKMVSPITLLAKDSLEFMKDEGIAGSDWITEVEALSMSIEHMKGKLKDYEIDRLKSERDNVEMERELKLARDIEMGIIPTKFPLFPERSDFDCYGKLIPAKIVGGDLFDFFLLDDNNLFVSICDTLGKGIPAAMFAVATRTLIRNFANPITRVGRMMELLNEELGLGPESDMFVTVIMGKLNLTNGEFAYCNAGHPRPIILKNDHQIAELETIHGFPIGVRNKQSFVESVITLAPGESIIAYTDGVTEEVDKYGSFFGKERLLSLLKNQNSNSPEKMVREILKELEKFRGKTETYDDTTVLAFKYYGKEKINQPSL